MTITDTYRWPLTINDIHRCSNGNHRRSTMIMITDAMIMITDAYPYPQTLNDNHRHILMLVDS